MRKQPVRVENWGEEFILPRGLGMGERFQNWTDKEMSEILMPFDAVGKLRRNTPTGVPGDFLRLDASEAEEKAFRESNKKAPDSGAATEVAENFFKGRLAPWQPLVAQAESDKPAESFDDLTPIAFKQKPEPEVPWWAALIQSIDPGTAAQAAEIAATTIAPISRSMFPEAFEDQNWSQKYEPVIQQASAIASSMRRQYTPPPQSTVTQRQSSGSSDVTGTQQARAQQDAANRVMAQQTAYANRVNQGHRGFSGENMEQTFNNLGDALRAMDSDYSQRKIRRRGPHSMVYAEYDESGVPIEEAQVNYYPDETKYTISHVSDQPVNTAIPRSANALPSDQAMSTEAAVALTMQPTGDGVVVSPLVDSVAADLTQAANSAASAATPAATTLAQKFNALDNPSKVLVAGALYYGAKSMLPSLLHPTSLMYLGVAAYLFNKSKQTKGA